MELLELAEKKTNPCQPFMEVSDPHGRRTGESGDTLEIGMDGRRERGEERIFCKKNRFPNTMLSCDSLSLSGIPM